MYAQDAQNTLKPKDARELAIAAVKLGQNEVWKKRFGYASDDVQALTATVNRHCSRLGEDASRIATAGRRLGVVVEDIKRFGYPTHVRDMEQLLVGIREYTAAFYDVVAEQVSEIERRHLGTYGLDGILDPSLLN